MTNALDEIYRRDILIAGHDMEPSVSGDIETVTGLLNLKQALLHRILTIPGTLIHRPDYGVGISRYQGSPLTFDRKRRLAVEIDAQCRLDPRVVRVMQIQVEDLENDDFGIVISINVEAVAYGVATFEFEIAGGVE